MQPKASIGNSVVEDQATLIKINYFNGISSRRLELGQASAGDAAAMAGLAPASNDSGTILGRRISAGGRQLTATCSVPGSPCRRLSQFVAPAFRKAPERARQSA